MEGVGDHNVVILPRPTPLFESWWFLTLFIICSCVRMNPALDHSSASSAHSLLFLVLLSSFSWNSSDNQIVTKHRVSDHCTLFFFLTIYHLPPPLLPSPSSFQPVEYDTPTDVVTVRTSGQEKPILFWFQLGINFFSSKPIYFWSKCCEQFKIRFVNWNRTLFHVGRKGICVRNATVEEHFVYLFTVQPNKLWAASSRHNVLVKVTKKESQQWRPTW